MTRKLNCWEFKQCGRRPGGENEKELGICPTTTEERLDGVHGGTKAGRACWVIAGSLCNCKVQGTFAAKLGSCDKCNFFQKVKEEEKEKYERLTALRARLNGESAEIANKAFSEEYDHKKEQRKFPNKVVVRFRDGTVKKGSIGNFSLNKKVVHLNLLNDEIVDINIEELKAIFFVKDFEGDSTRLDIYCSEVPGGGRKIQIEFIDGEIITGFSQTYSSNREGFLVVPADNKSNNTRVFVVTSAIKKVTPL